MHVTKQTSTNFLIPQWWEGHQKNFELLFIQIGGLETRLVEFRSFPLKNIRQIDLSIISNNKEIDFA